VTDRNKIESASGSRTTAIAMSSAVLWCGCECRQHSWPSQPKHRGV